MRNAVLLLSIWLLAGCAARVNFNETAPGEFSGRLHVVWVGSGEDPGEDLSGDGRFIYIPEPSRELTFRRPDGVVIQPEPFYTDGGSVPRIATVVPGLSPWGYGPAYIIHDWIFIAKNCLTDNDETELERAVEGMDFDDSVEIMAEAIQALMQQDLVSAARADAAQIITDAVSTNISRRLWEQPGRCEEHRRVLDDPVLSSAYRAVPGLARLSSDPGAVPGVLVSTIDFGSIAEARNAFQASRTDR
ncbi:MAG: DUF1353 domain-containing protein [Pseudomonadota bacterium]